MSEDTSINQDPTDTGDSIGIVDAILQYRAHLTGIIALVCVAYAGMTQLGWVPPIYIETWHILWLSAGAIGYVAIGGGTIVTYGDRFTPDGRSLKLDSVAGIADTITIPTETFKHYDIAGSMPLTRSITGEEQWRIRGIDTKRKELIPAGTAPDDDRYPDDYVVIAEQGDLSAVEALENALLEDAEKGRQQQVSNEVRMEMALQRVVKQFASSMKDVRDSSNNGAEIPEQQIDRAARDAEQKIIQEMAEGGDVRSGDGE